MARRKTSVRGELKKAGKGILGEMGRQIFGGSTPKKKKKKGGGAVHVHHQYIKQGDINHYWGGQHIKKYKRKK